MGFMPLFLRKRGLNQSVQSRLQNHGRFPCVCDKQIHMQSWLRLCTGDFRQYQKNSGENLLLPLNSPAAKDLSEFFLKLKPDSLDDFINKYAKKRFGNVETALSIVKQFQADDF
jgi:hypothetical protein